MKNTCKYECACPTQKEIKECLRRQSKREAHRIEAFLGGEDWVKVDEDIQNKCETKCSICKEHCKGTCIPG
jgi:hypothetical protein